MRSNLHTRLKIVSSRRIVSADDRLDRRDRGLIENLRQILAERGVNGCPRCGSYLRRPLFEFQDNPKPPAVATVTPTCRECAQTGNAAFGDSHAGQQLHAVMVIFEGGHAAVDKMMAVMRTRRGVVTEDLDDDGNRMVAWTAPEVEANAVVAKLQGMPGVVQAVNLGRMKANKD
jgi:hypothetical protein